MKPVTASKRRGAQESVGERLARACEQALRHELESELSTASAGERRGAQESAEERARIPNDEFAISLLLNNTPEEACRLLKHYGLIRSDERAQKSVMGYGLWYLVAVALWGCALGLYIGATLLEK